MTLTSNKFTPVSRGEAPCTLVDELAHLLLGGRGGNLLLRGGVGLGVVSGEVEGLNSMSDFMLPRVPLSFHFFAFLDRLIERQAIPERPTKPVVRRTTLP
jgi:hypothetical protein